MLELSELDKLGIAEEALISALYGEMQRTLLVGKGTTDIESEFSRRKNGSSHKLRESLRWSWKEPRSAKTLKSQGKFFNQQPKLGLAQSIRT